MLIDRSCAFDAVHTFECGQCFRWNNVDGVYTGISGGRICHIQNRELICKDEDAEYWNEYFAFNTNYDEIKNSLISLDKNIGKCVEYGYGIRILKQDIWETIISFIISANNNIPRIKKIIEAMCELFGEPIYDGEKLYYAFPSPEKLSGLTCEDLSPLRAGYRDKYILDAAQKVASGEVDLNALKFMTDKDAKSELTKIKGVGGKVADCIMLFSLERFSVFPTDVWIKRILNEIYGVEDKEIQGFVQNKFGDLAGFAQQYLYYYYRDNNTAK